MILQQDMAFIPLSKIGPVFIFTIGYQCPECRCPTFVFQNFEAIHPMFYMIALYQNPPSIPVSYPVKRLIAAWYGQVLCWDQFIQRTYCSVTGYPFFGVWMDFIIQDLIFESDGRSGSCVEIGVYKILDTRVGTLRQFKFKSEFEIGKFILCNYIATIGRFGPTARQHTQFTVFDRPALLWKMVQLGTD